MGDMERRRHPRVKLQQPMRGAVGAAPVAVVDISCVGIGVAHAAELPPPGGVIRIELQTEYGPITLDCAIVRTVTRPSKRYHVLFQTGMEVLSADRQSVARLQTITATRR